MPARNRMTSTAATAPNENMGGRVAMVDTNPRSQPKFERRERVAYTKEQEEMMQRRRRTTPSYSIQKSPKSDDWALVTPAPFLSRDITACLPTKQSKNAGGGDS